MKIEIKMPALRDEETPGVLCQWNAEAGDVVEAGDVLFEVETAKVVSEVEASARIRILDLLCEEGDEIKPGTTIALAETVDEP